MPIAETHCLPQEFAVCIGRFQVSQGWNGGNPYISGQIGLELLCSFRCGRKSADLGVGCREISKRFDRLHPDLEPCSRIGNRLISGWVGCGNKTGRGHRFTGSRLRKLSALNVDNVRDKGQHRMSWEIAALVLLAAALHAGWNALVKISGDRLAVMAFITLTGSIVSIPFIFIVDSPSPQSWPLLALTILLHTAYHLFLPIAYDHGDLGQVYPIARGSAPLLVTLGAIFLAGEHLPPIATIGVVCLSVGVMALTFTGPATPRSTIRHLLCPGHRHLHRRLHSRRWVWRKICRIFPGIRRLAYGRGRTSDLCNRFNVERARNMARCTRKSQTGFAGGAMQVGAYWIIVSALAVAPMGLVSAMRETSVLFAALISTFLLKEGLGVWRFVSASFVILALF